MEEPLKRLLKKLSDAISDSIDESDSIAEAIGEINKAGYKIFLVIEGTIGLSKKEESEEDMQRKKKMEEHDKIHEGQAPKIKFTLQDKRFVKAIGIEDPDKGK